MLKAVAVFVALVGSVLGDHHMTTEGPVIDVCPLQGQTPPKYTGTATRYVLGWFGDGDATGPPVDGEGEERAVLMVPYTPDMCHTVAPLAGLPKAKFTCDADGMGYTLTMHFPDDQMCSNTPMSSMHYNMSNVYPLLTWNCNSASVDAYSTVSFTALDSLCQNDPIYPALGVCAVSKMPPALANQAFVEFTCTDSATTTSYFTASQSMCANDDLFCLKQDITTTCAVALTTSEGQDIYAQHQGCSVGAGNGDDDDSAASFSGFSLIAMLLSFLLALLHA